MWQIGRFSTLNSILVAKQYKGLPLPSSHTVRDLLMNGSSSPERPTHERVFLSHHTVRDLLINGSSSPHQSHCQRPTHERVFISPPVTLSETYSWTGLHLPTSHCQRPIHERVFISPPVTVRDLLINRSSSPHQSLCQETYSWTGLHLPISHTVRDLLMNGSSSPHQSHRQRPTHQQVFISPSVTKVCVCVCVCVRARVCVCVLGAEGSRVHGRTPYFQIFRITYNRKWKAVPSFSGTLFKVRFISYVHTMFSYDEHE